MRSPEEEPIRPEHAGALLAIDATLAGDPVDPEYAELAELALLLRHERPAVRDSFAAGMDERVERRFAKPAAGGASRRSWRGWVYGPAAALAAAAGVVVVIAVAGGGGAISSNSSSSASGAVASTSASAGATKHPNVAPDLARRGAPASSGAATGSGAALGSAASSSSSTPSLAAAPGPAPAPSGNRQIVQSAQIQLSTAPNRIDDVAQQVFDAIGAEKGVVDSSNVTATGDANGNATFQLSVPSANLSNTLTTLSRLRGANVVSRTDTTADVTGQVGGAGQRLAEARALRRSLLRQLAAAVTTAQVDSLRLQLRSADAAIASDLSTLRGLQRQVAYSRIALTIQAVATPAPAAGSSFTLDRAAHDAGRVLVIVAGVALIAVAVLVPVGLVAALVAWAGFAVRRRRREQALDLV